MATKTSASNPPVSDALADAIVNAPPATSPENGTAARTVLPVSVIDRALQYKTEYTTLRAQAIQTILDQRRVLDEQLRELGHVDPTTERPKLVSKHPCRVCGATDHDARHHRKDNIAKLKKQKR